MVTKSDWRPVQFFLHEKPMAVAEVQTRSVPHGDDQELILFRCTCKEYSDSPLVPCVHIGIVFKRIQALGGGYITNMRRNDIDPDLLAAASEDIDAYRYLMVHESTIEVIRAEG